MQPLIQLQGAQRRQASHGEGGDGEARQQSCSLVVGLGWVVGLGGVGDSKVVVCHNSWLVIRFGYHVGDGLVIGGGGECGVVGSAAGIEITAHSVGGRARVRRRNDFGLVTDGVVFVVVKLKQKTAGIVNTAHSIV